MKSSKKPVKMPKLNKEEKQLLGQVLKQAAVTGRMPGVPMKCGGKAKK